MPHTVEICTVHISSFFPALIKSKWLRPCECQPRFTPQQHWSKEFLLLCNKDTRKIPARKQARHALTDSWLHLHCWQIALLLRPFCSDRLVFWTAPGSWSCYRTHLQRSLMEPGICPALFHTRQIDCSPAIVCPIHGLSLPATSVLLKSPVSVANFKKNMVAYHVYTLMDEIHQLLAWQAVPVHQTK